MASPSPRELWQRFQARRIAAAGVVLDTSRIDFPPDFFSLLEAPARKAIASMEALEKGSIANPDENRMVGHYWLRAPELAPAGEIRSEIEATVARLKRFADEVQRGVIRPERAHAFRNLLVIGIGGSALGPQFVADALGSDRDRLRPFFFDNTDPEGIDRVLGAIAATAARAGAGAGAGDDGGLPATLAIVVSKSGGTKETRNGMLEAQAAYRKAGLAFSRHAVAVTSAGSLLDKLAHSETWLDRFPMWDWVGGRTSELSAVGLLPAALQGIDIDGMLRGARAMDAATREKNPQRNAAMQLALAWYHATDGRGARDMVVLPYKDRLLLLSRYLQQLVMESLGKELDLGGKIVHQGIAVYGNKGSTDQHSYIQQLREGVPNFFATFIEVLKDREGESIEVEPGTTSGDYLLGFLLGTREALYEKGRQSVTVTVDAVTPESVGGLIALYERAVGFYASLVNINAYHQPGVEAGKKAAERALKLQSQAMAELDRRRGQEATAEEIAAAIGEPEKVESVYRILVHLAANRRGVTAKGIEAPATARFSAGQ